jgi:lambda family phage minor tail protein L
MPTSLETFNAIISGSTLINSEISSLTPSAQIILYEIDLSEIAPQTKNYNNNNTDQPINNGIFRVYNDYNLFNIINSQYQYGQLKFQNNFYYPFPIFSEGFELSSAGTQPTPTFSISNISPDKSNNSFYKYIRMQIESLGDIVGAKFTRIKTFLKYLNHNNFSAGLNPYNPNGSIYDIELPRDIYYIDRKIAENKNTVQYQLATILDLENLVLPSRTIFSTKCPFQYRGEGCVYEYNSRLTAVHSGIYANTVNPSTQIYGLKTAPPVATENNELFVGDIFKNSSTASHRITGAGYQVDSNAKLGDSGSWVDSADYVSGDFVFLQNKNIKYYYVCINNHKSNFFNAPPTKNYWLSDTCEKSITACRLRWLKNPSFRPVIWPTNRNGEDFIKTCDRFRNLLTQAERDSLVSSGIVTPENFPRRPGCENPTGLNSHGLPKDKDGNYLNGFLPFGGFPGTNQPNL